MGAGRARPGEAPRAGVDAKGLTTAAPSAVLPRDAVQRTTRTLRVSARRVAASVQRWDALARGAVADELPQGVSNNGFSAAPRQLAQQRPLDGSPEGVGRYVELALCKVWRQDPQDHAPEGGFNFAVELRNGWRVSRSLVHRCNQRMPFREPVYDPYRPLADTV